ncbi:MAG: hypothetical protein GIW99_01325 [Candidatus Eremiobacteraeota bacterium]|nr:hypothetical protein [Candidatus Eremiobacteraeota bacterium]
MRRLQSGKYLGMLTYLGNLDEGGLAFEAHFKVGSRRIAEEDRRVRNPGSSERMDKTLQFTAPLYELFARPVET